MANCKYCEEEIVWDHDEELDRWSPNNEDGTPHRCRSARAPRETPTAAYSRGFEQGNSVGYENGFEAGAIVGAAGIETPVDASPNIWGSVFNDPRFVFAEYTHSQRPEAHHNLIRSWRLV